MSAFNGIRILDFSQGIGGPMAASLLADFGAEVIKIEGPGGDRHAAHPGYLAHNHNKQRLVLNLETYEGLHAARDLIATADVAIFDGNPGTLERLGLDATTLLARHPALIHVWLPFYAVNGRWSQLPPDELLLGGISGVSFQQPSYAEQPVSQETPQISYAQGMDTAGAIAAALYARARTGRGESVVVSGMHAVASIESGGQTKFGATMAMPRPGVGGRGGTPNYRLYQCKDGLWLFLATLTPAFFLRALEAMNLLDLIAEPGVDGEFANLLAPPMDKVAIEWLDRRFAEEPRGYWLKLLLDSNVPRGPVGHREEWFQSETVTASEMRVRLEHPTLGPVEIPGVPVKLSETPGAVRSLMTDTTLEAIPAHAPALPANPVPPAGPGPLAGVRVLDLGAFIAGTFAPTILANYGANVVKVEALDGDAFRMAGMQFAGHNRGKRGLSLDLKDPAALEIFFDLVRQSDVILDNYRNGVRERLGIDYATLKKINPRLISCSITGYGPVGPFASDPGFDPVLQARSGMMAGQGGDDEPIFYQVAVNDSATAMMGAFGMIAALVARERTGKGQEVITSLANQSVLCQSGEITNYAGRPANPPGARDRLGSHALRRYFQCADGWVGIACTAPHHFPQLCTALGHPEWAGRYIAEKAILEPVGSPLDGLVAETLATMSRDDIVDRCLSRGVPAAPAYTLPERFADPFAAENNCFDDYTHATYGEVTGPRAFADFRNAGGGFVRPAPILGEHSVEVLREYGIAEDRINDLLSRKLLVQP